METGHAAEQREPPYPLRIEGRLDADLSRWLWVVKWLLAIPHYIVLAFLWLAFFVLTVVAFFAILIVGRYPRGIFDFNVGVLRWTWRVAFYSYGALGTDRYPPFTLDDVPDYPARLELDYPERLSRGLVLVKWWLLAIPHYLLVGIMLGGGSYAASKTDRWGGGFAWGLIALLVLIAGFSLVFAGRYPRGIFDFVVGLDRWVARVAAYAGLMTDRYPPFRLDQGGDEPGAVQLLETVPAAPPESARPVGGGGAGRVVLIVLGIIAAILSFALLAGGAALAVLDQTQRDEDGFLMSPDEEFATPTYAVVSQSADIDVDGAGMGARHVPRNRSHPERERATRLHRDRPRERCGRVPRRRRARRRDRPRGRAQLRARGWSRALGPAGRRDVLGRERFRLGRADARVGARGW